MWEMISVSGEDWKNSNYTYTKASRVSVKNVRFLVDEKETPNLHLIVYNSRKERWAKVAATLLFL